MLHLPRIPYILWVLEWYICVSKIEFLERICLISLCAELQGALGIPVQVVLVAMEELVRKLELDSNATVQKILLDSTASKECVS